MTASALQTSAHDHSSELLEHLIAEEISLQVQNIADGLQQERWPSAAKDTTRCGNDWGSCGSFDWLQPRPDQSRAITSRASLPNRFFAAVITATLKEKCDIELMSPIFRCLGCGQYIERSLATYKKHMGQIFCSTCNDRKQLDAATGSKKT